MFLRCLRLSLSRYLHMLFLPLQPLSSADRALFFAVPTSVLSCHTVVHSVARSPFEHLSSMSVRSLLHAGRPARIRLTLLVPQPANAVPSGFSFLLLPDASPADTATFLP